MQHMLRRSLRLRTSGEEGIALVVSLMALTLMMALGVALILTTMTETKITSVHRDAAEAFYAAEAAIERTLQELLNVSDWDTVLAGTVTSPFSDGPPAGTRALADGRTLDLTQATNLVRCGKVSFCTDADMIARTSERPWGNNNPRWQIYAFGPIAGLLPAVSVDSRTYVVVWIGDDPAENDDDPLKDGLPCVSGGECVNSGKGVISMLAHAYGAGGVMRIIEVTLSRTDKDEGEPEDPGVRIVSWREARY
jgi:hypothetical protein